MGHVGGNLPDSSLILWDYDSGQIIHRMAGHEGGIFDIAFTPDSKQALSASQDGELMLWDLESGTLVNRLVGHQSSVNSVEISDDGEHAISGSLGGDIIYWNLKSGEIVHRMLGHFEGRGVYDVAFLPDDKAISSAWDATLIIWDLASGNQVRRLTGFDSVTGGHFEFDGDAGIHGLPGAHARRGALAVVVKVAAHQFSQPVATGGTKQ